MCICAEARRRGKTESGRYRESQIYRGKKRGEGDMYMWVLKPDCVIKHWKPHIPPMTWGRKKSLLSFSGQMFYLTEPAWSLHLSGTSSCGISVRGWILKSGQLLVNERMVWKWTGFQHKGFTVYDIRRCITGRGTWASPVSSVSTLAQIHYQVTITETASEGRNRSRGWGWCWRKQRHTIPSICETAVELHGIRHYFWRIMTIIKKKAGPTPIKTFF